MTYDHQDQCGWEIIHKNGHRLIVVGAKPAMHELFESVEPIYRKPQPAVAPVPPEMQGIVNDAIVQAFFQAVGQTKSGTARERLLKQAKNFAIKYWLNKPHDSVDYKNAAERVAFGFYGVLMPELSEEEQEKCRRVSRSALNTGYKLLGKQ